MRVDHPFRAAFDIVARGAPIEVQLVVTRRCNLSCGYCSEYDKHSPEVPYDVLAARIAAIHRLRAANIALLGGEPLLHSRIDDVVRCAATRAQVSVTTNGLLLDREMIDRLGDAGLANMQVSIDALRPSQDRYLQKTLHSLGPKLERLAAHARFDVLLTIVLCPETLAEFDELERELERFPFRISVNILHDHHGQASVAGAEFEGAWRRHFENGRPFSFIEEDYGRRLLSGERPSWTCRAGARFLYVGEDGMAELCSGQRGRIGKQIVDYTEADLEAHRHEPKGCEEGCGILCAYRDSQIDNDPVALGRALWRAFRHDMIHGLEPEGGAPSNGRGSPHRHLPIADGGRGACAR
jgi:MoaA/NifB/PqqE/SkfB family radical SAM enzyme